MNVPNGSSPVRVITAARRPYLAAATATLVALPPSHLPKVWTSSSPTPTCSGYRSALTRPIVRTSSAVISWPPSRALRLIVPEARQMAQWRGRSSAPGRRNSVAAFGPAAAAAVADPGSTEDVSFGPPTGRSRRAGGRGPPACESHAHRRSSPGGSVCCPEGRSGYCFFTPALLAGQEYVRTYLRNDLTTARLSGVIIGRTAEVAAAGRGSHGPCRPSHPGGPEQPGPALLPGGTAPGAPDRVR